MPRVDLQFTTGEAPRAVLGDFARVMTGHPRVRVRDGAAPGVLVMGETSFTYWRIIGAFLLFPIGLYFIVPPLNARVTVTAHEVSPGVTNVSVSGRTTNGVIARGYAQMADVLTQQVPPTTNQAAQAAG